jgi:hypothetical protein
MDQQKVGSCEHPASHKCDARGLLTRSGLQPLSPDGGVSLEFVGCLGPRLRTAGSVSAGTGPALLAGRAADLRKSWIAPPRPGLGRRGAENGVTRTRLWSGPLGSPKC